MPISSNGLLRSNRFSRLFLLLLGGLLFGLPGFGAPPSRWSAASFRGLVVGHSAGADAVRVLGMPDSRRSGVNSPALAAPAEELIYRGRGDHKGDLAVRLDRSRTIVEIQESFPVAIPRTRIYKEFGPNPVTAHYSIARCAGDVLYRDAAGAIELTLYPERGLVLWPDQYGYDFAAILYLARAPGANHAPACVSRR